MSPRIREQDNAMAMTAKKYNLAAAFSGYAIGYAYAQVWKRC
jgi:hypothetical protein